MPRFQQRIDEINGEQEQQIDCSLRGQAMRRAVSADAPRTLTPWEWEEYYARHGQPDAHVPAGKPSKSRWWRGFVGRWFSKGGQ